MKIREVEDYIEVMTNKGWYKVDKEFKHLFEHLEWFAGYYGYLSVNDGGIKRFHRIVTNAPKGQVVDHINRDVTDNRLKNLRVVSRPVNARNKGKPIKVGDRVSSSIYKGVAWSKHAKKWRVVSKNGKKQVHIGYFKNEIDAAKAYDEYSYREYNDISILNFPDSVLK